MSLASLDVPVSPSAPLLPGETYFLTPRRASAREQANSIRFTTSPAASTGASAFRAPASLPLRSPRAVSDGNIPLMRGTTAGGWALRRDLEASVANVSFNHSSTLQTRSTSITAAAAAAVESIPNLSQTAGVWSCASSSSAAESPSCASGSTRSREETLETCFGAQESFGSGRGSSFDDNDDESDWSRRHHDGPSSSFNGRHGYYTDDWKAPVLQKSRTYCGAQRGNSGDDSMLHADEVPLRCHVAPSPRAAPNAILAELAVLEEEIPLEMPLEEPARDLNFSAAATSGAPGAPRARAPPPAVAEAASLKGKVLAALARFTPRHLRRAASASSSGKEAMAATDAPLPGNEGFIESMSVGSVGSARRNADLPPLAVAAAAAAAHRGFGRSGTTCGDDDAESAQGWVDMEGPMLMMTDTRIRHLAPPGSGSSSSGMGRQGRAASLAAAQGGEHPLERCDEWHSYSSGLTPLQRAQVRLSEDSLRERSGSAAARNEYVMPPASERYLSGPPLLQATY
ncbi:unnamed protein product [Closterium sp. Yama58-4]|nr:unnamed protein product [Closterium sp. Yama58-4]